MKTLSGAPDRSERQKSGPTQIWLPDRARTILVLVVGVLLTFVAYAAPAVPLVAAGGFSAALALSFPVRFLSRFVPRPVATLACGRCAASWISPDRGLESGHGRGF